MDILAQDNSCPSLLKCLKAKGLWGMAPIIEQSQYKQLDHPFLSMIPCS
jgi:hypothetical protein